MLGRELGSMRAEYAEFAEYAEYAEYAKYAEYDEYAECAEYADWFKQSMPGSVVPLAMFKEEGFH